MQAAPSQIPGCAASRSQLHLPVQAEVRLEESVKGQNTTRRTTRTATPTIISKPELGPHGNFNNDKAGERAEHIPSSCNWAVKVRILGGEHALTVVDTLGDGNCLFHASILGLVGLLCDRNDRENNLSHGILRRMVRHFLAAHKAELLDALKSACATAEEFDPEAEFEEAKKEAETGEAATVSLHTYALANVLWRPIIVYAPSVHPAFPQLSSDSDSMGACRFADDSSDDVLRPHNGVFLPLLRDSHHCCKDPLVLAYAPPRGVHGELVGHFSACLPTRVEGQTAAVKIPLGQSSTEPHMPVRFAPANADQRQMLEKYLRIEEIGVGERRSETPTQAVGPSSPSGSNPQLQEALRKSLDGAAERSEGAFVLAAKVISCTHISGESHPWVSPTRTVARRDVEGY